MASRASLDSSPRSNWVEESGELPPEVRSRARALQRENPSWTMSRCIATAISQYRKEGNAVVIAKWEALKAKNRVRMAGKRS